MTNAYDSDPDDRLVVGGKEYTLTYHVIRRIEERYIEREWIANVLTAWVARKFNEANNSMCYFGIIPGLSRLLMVAVSENRPSITTVHPNRNATKFYSRNQFDYFDEVRG